MCGIAGAVSWRRSVSMDAVAALTHAVAHRGPDDQGLWQNPGGQCGLGHRRLSIIDLSAAGHQPMIDPSTGNVIVFNGEIYNFKELREDCEAAGEYFASHSDTEVILALYRRHGIGCVGRLRGMFAFAIWDERRQQLVIARDRVGKKPLNYALTEAGIAFCSELEPLSRHAGADSTMDHEALELYLQCQYIPAPWTIYRGIRKLPAAHIAVFSRAGLALEQYWTVDYRRKIRIAEADALDALEEKLAEAVRLRMISDVPLGALLSGGVDSSVVVALMAKLSGAPVRTFSMGFAEEAFNELPFAEEAAKRCGTLHHPEIVHADVEHLLPQLARHYGEPFADASAVPSFLVSQAARRHVTVAMNGDGGDELLGGYPRYWLSPFAMRLSPWLSGAIPPARALALVSRFASAKTLPQRAARKLLTEYIQPHLSSVTMYGDFWNDAERAALMGAAGREEVLPRWRAQWLAEACAHATNPVDRMLWLDNRTYLAGDLLVKMDIAAMHCGLETRSPLLDHEVIEYCAALPAGLKVKNGVGKYLLKKLAERYFPVSFVHRPKMGFGIPLAAWLRGPLRATLEGVLRDEATMAPLNIRYIGQILDEFLLRNVDHSSRLWALLMYGNWRSKGIAPGRATAA
jgi:asparagine synthase (glutamine-hydrolysing)